MQPVITEVADITGIEAATASVFKATTGDNK